MPKPWISVNFAISADGKISPVVNKPSGWTSSADYDRLLLLRQGADALLVGKGTMEKDRMTMTVQGKKPLRCIVSHSGHMDMESTIFKTPGGQIHLCVTGDVKIDLAGVTVHHLPLADFITKLGSDFDVRHIHCEGGGQLVRELMEMDLIDEFHLTLAGHTIFGGFEAPTVTGIPAGFPDKSLDFELSVFEPRLGEGECFLSYRRRRL